MQYTPQNLTILWDQHVLVIIVHTGMAGFIQYICLTRVSLYFVNNFADFPDVQVKKI